MLRLAGSDIPRRRELSRAGDEPKPTGEPPKAPRWLNAEARKAWDHIVGELESMGVIHAADMHALAMLCDQFARWREIRRRIDREGWTITARRRGETVRLRHPLAADLTKLDSAVPKLLHEFGLTPSGRARIAVVDSSGESLSQLDQAILKAAKRDPRGRKPKTA